MNPKLLLLPQRYIFSSKSQLTANSPFELTVVVATTKVHIFKQITTNYNDTCRDLLLLLLPQRYIFSSKSQLLVISMATLICCCCYHKGTYFQANHNHNCYSLEIIEVVVATTKVHIFKQITTNGLQAYS